MATLEAVAAVLGTVKDSMERMEAKLDDVVVGLAETKLVCADTQKDMIDMRTYCADRSGKISDRVKVVENAQTEDKAFRNGKRAGENQAAGWIMPIMKYLAVILAGIAAGAGGLDLIKAVMGM